MRSYKTKAIILKQFEIGEADRLITVFSEDLGLMTLRAPGVRKILAKLKGHLELFTYSQLLIYRSHGAIDVITGAETIYSFRKLRESLQSTSRLYLLAEFLNRIIPEREPYPEIFGLLHYVLRDIEKEKSRPRRLILTSYFFLRSLKSLGYSPHFRECIRCQSYLDSGGNYFDNHGAGTVCSACAQIKNDLAQSLSQVSDKGLIALRVLNENETIELSKIKADDEILEEVAKIIENYVEYILEAELKSKKFIKQVDNR